MRTAAILVGLVGFAAVYPGHGQAVAEGAMVHANSAAATAKVGTALGNALSKTMSGNAANMESVSPGKIEHVPHAQEKKKGAANTGEPSQAFVITSIRGEHKPCAATAPVAARQSGAGAASAANAAASSESGARSSSSKSQDCLTPAAGQKRSKSVVNLSFPQ